MDNLYLLISDSISKYYKVLATTGYISDTEVTKLVALQGLQYFMECLEEFLTEDDIRNIRKAINCLSGNCLIDSQLVSSNNSLFHKIKQKTKCELELQNI